MNPAAVIASASASVALAVAIGSWRVARAPGWGELRHLSLIALTAAAYALGNLTFTTDQPDALVRAVSHAQLAALLVQVWGWSRFVEPVAGPLPARLARPLRALALAFAGLALVPGLFYEPEVRDRLFAPWGVTYREVSPTALGTLSYLFALAFAAVVIGHVAHAARRGSRFAWHYAAGFTGLLLLGASDAAASSGVADAPYLLDVGFLLPLAFLSLGAADRFVADARALQALRGRLEGLVEERTRALGEVREALHQAEKLAALGQFAAGVAHEVNNPASVVSANLAYLSDAARGGPLPPDAGESLEEAREAMRRINDLVRRLGDAGRLAASGLTAGATPLGQVLEAAADEARVRLGDRVSLALLPCHDLSVRARAEVLQQVLSALVANAADAIPSGRRGTVTLEATRRDDGRIRVVVADDGVGMAPEVLRRAFEPFFTTKPEGMGAGLGLSVARALVESLGGTLTLESAPGKGTRAVFDVPEAAPA